MSRAEKKSRKLRGHVSHGHGRVGKHRCHSSGRGNAGGEHHHRTNLFKYHPGYYGKSGIRVFRLHKNREYSKSLNLDKLWTLVSENARNTYLNNAKKDTAPVIDVTKNGYFKVMGRGRLPAVPVVVKAKVFSKTAERRIKAVGGSCVLVA
jgi:large subunit ribosomal protein L27Ae